MGASRRAPWRKIDPKTVIRPAGNGAAAIALNPKPADWTAPRVHDQTDGDLFWKISTGRGAMPSWKQLPERERWALVRFIRTLEK